MKVPAIELALFASPDEWGGLAGRPAATNADTAKLELAAALARNSEEISVGLGSELLSAEDPDPRTVADLAAAADADVDGFSVGFLGSSRMLINALGAVLEIGSALVAFGPCAIRIPASAWLSVNTRRCSSNRSV